MTACVQLHAIAPKDSSERQYLLERLSESLDALVYPDEEDSTEVLDIRYDLDIHHKLGLVEQACLLTILSGICYESSNYASNYCQGLFALLARLFGPVDTPTEQYPAAGVGASSQPPKSRGSIRNIVSRHRREKKVRQQGVFGGTLPEVPHNLPKHGAHPPIKHDEQPPKQDKRSLYRTLPSSSAVYKVSVLTRIPQPTEPTRVAHSAPVEGHKPSSNSTAARVVQPPRTYLLKGSVEALYRDAALVAVWILASRLAATHGDREAALDAAQAAARLVHLRDESSRQNKAVQTTNGFPEQMPALGCGLVRDMSQLRADVLCAEADALVIGSSAPREPFASMESRDLWRELGEPSAAATKRATALYRDALNKDPCHHDATVGLCQLLMDERSRGEHQGENASESVRAKAEVHQRLERLVESSQGYRSPVAWNLYGQISLSLNILSPLGGDPFAEAAKWEAQAPLRPWYNANASGFVLW
ncbi:MAG: hypothetical protein Q9159_000650 [Coniocarpon cinnabarinum]